MLQLWCIKVVTQRWSTIKLKLNQLLIYHILIKVFWEQLICSTHTRKLTRLSGNHFVSTLQSASVQMCWVSERDRLTAEIRPAKTHFSSTCCLRSTWVLYHVPADKTSFIADVCSSSWARSKDVVPTRRLSFWVTCPPLLDEWVCGRREHVR